MNAQHILLTPRARLMEDFSSPRYHCDFATVGSPENNVDATLDKVEIYESALDVAMKKSIRAATRAS